MSENKPYVVLSVTYNLAEEIVKYVINYTKGRPHPWFLFKVSVKVMLVWILSWEPEGSVELMCKSLCVYVWKIERNRTNAGGVKTHIVWVSK